MSSFSPLSSLFSLPPWLRGECCSTNPQSLTTMNTLFHHGVLFAQNRLESMSSGLRGRRVRIGTEDMVTGVLVLAGIVLVAWILSYISILQERHHTYTSPVRLFLQLCRAHKLPWRKRWLLWRVARAQRLRDPARMFLEPERFHASQLSPALRNREGELRRLSEELFGEMS